MRLLAFYPLIATQLFFHPAVATVCPWTEVGGERLLDGRVGSFSSTDMTVEGVWDALVSQHAVPLSFIQAAPEAKVSLDLRGATVRQVLDAVVARAPAYRYEVIGDRLVLFPRDLKWEMRLEGFTSGPARRLDVAVDLVRELKRRDPDFAGLIAPAYRVIGSEGAIYRDVVKVVSPGTILELLVQLLGQRPSAVFSLGRDRWGHQFLDLSGVQLLQSFELTAPSTTLRDRADTVQLKVLGRLRGLGERLDFTAGGCGTTYSSSDEGVITVSADGLVSVRGTGRAVVIARNDDSLSSLPLTVILTAEQVRPRPGAPPRATGGGKPLVAAALQLAQGAAAACSWPEATGERLLARKVGDLSVTLVEVEKAVAEIAKQSDLPMSFIQADSHRKISLTLRDASVRQALDEILRQAPEYRYGLVAERLVLYPHDPIWETRLDNLSLGPGPRFAVTGELAKELSRRLPALAYLSGPWMLGNGNSYTYRDIVSVTGPGSILDLFVQLLGGRPSTFFILDKPSEVRGSLSVSSMDQLRSLKVTAPTTTFHRSGEAAQLKMTGLLRSGGEKDLSAGACGTVYSVNDDRVVGVTADGLVSAGVNGTAAVTVSNEHSSASIVFEVRRSDSPAPAAPLAPAGKE